MTSESSRTIRPYGDDTNDGKVQVSFTLPVGSDARAEAAALALAEQMGLRSAVVVHQKAMGPEFTFFIVYGAVDHAVDLDGIVVRERPFPLLEGVEVKRRVLEALGRPAVVIGASLGTDAHTVGLDAILSLKGIAGDKGLESYPAFRVVNLKSQVAPSDLAARAQAEGADAVLVSQTVTQKDAHLHHLREFAAAVDAAGLRGRFLMIAGGPRLSPDMAEELGYDRIFGRGTTPTEVASYLAWSLTGRAADG
ncbi:MAG: cobalamin-dependent protein [Actinobacteria bacterium]|nr:cobalamin-dependent protein [Actinomycetota bacterium]